MRFLILLAVCVSIVLAETGFGEVAVPNFDFTTNGNTGHNADVFFYTGECNGSINVDYNADLELYTGISTNVTGEFCFFVNGTTTSMCNGAEINVVEQNTNFVLAGSTIDLSFKPVPIDLAFCYKNYMPSNFGIVVALPGYCKVSGQNIIFNIEQTS